MDPGPIGQILTALAPARLFYPVFALITILWLSLRWLARRGDRGARWDRVVGALERGLLTALLLAMLGFAGLQIVLRNLFHTGLIWIEPLLRHLVLWIGFVGAVAATGRLRHIQMDVLGRLLPPPLRLLALRLTTLAAAVVCAVLARASWVFLSEEQAFGATGFLGIPTWLLTSVLLLGFVAMSVRFLARALAAAESLRVLARESRGEAGGPAEGAGHAR